MAEASSIEWTDATWNPITGCSVLSAGCRHCYAMKLAGTRLRQHPSRAGLTIDSKAGPVWTGELRFNEAWLDQPLRWKRPRRIFVCAHGDLFHENAPGAWLDRIFAVMALAPQHTFQVLTKRIGRARDYLIDESLPRRLELAMDAITLVQPGAGGWPLPNVWLGVSVEDQTAADARIPLLLETPAALRFLSCEPLLGPLDLAPWLYWRETEKDGEVLPGVDWVIAGGESGPGARPMHPDWPRALRDQCDEADVAFFFKQWGEWSPGENVERRSGVVDVAWGSEFGEGWLFGRENLAAEDGHRDDEPDLYRVGKRAAGRLLDGVEHSAFPDR